MLSGALQPFNDHLGCPLHQFVAQMVVLLASLTKARAVEKYGLDRRYRSRVEMPGNSRSRPSDANASVACNSAAMTSTSSDCSPAGRLRFTSQYGQSKLQCLSGFMFTPMDKPRARGEITRYRKRLFKNSRGQPNAVEKAEVWMGFGGGEGLILSGIETGFDSCGGGAISSCMR